MKEYAVDYTTGIAPFRIRTQVLMGIPKECVVLLSKYHFPIMRYIIDFFQIIRMKDR